MLIHVIKLQVAVQFLFVQCSYVLYYFLWCEWLLHPLVHEFLDVLFLSTILREDYQLMSL